MLKYNYYYHVGEYMRNAGSKNPYRRDGFDVSSWMFTGEKKQITKELYDRIVEDEVKIIKEMKERYNLTIGFHHMPIKILKEEDENI